MPKHNIAAIAAVCYAAAHVFDQGGQVTEEDYVALEPYPSMDADTRDRWETMVLKEIHGTDADQAGGTPDEQRRARLFKAIVKALTVRL